MEKIAIMPGSFDPFTKGHESLLRRGLALFDHIVIGVGINSCKRMEQTCAQRINALRELFAGDPRILVRGLVRHVAMWMDSADLFITKPGGVSTTEAACKRLPMLFVNAVSGCEEYNLRFFLRRGVASTANTPKEIARQAVRLLTNAERLRQMASRYEDAEVIPAAYAISQYIVQEYGAGRR